MTISSPLQGIFVADFTESLAGPFCGQILADLGADVVKIERPGGDPSRQWGPPFWAGDGTLFLSANRGKRSLEIDLKGPHGSEVVRRLVTRADVVLHSFRLGVAESLGLGYAQVRAVSDRVIYCDITAWGHRGPRREEPGYDPVVQACAGLMSVTGHPASPPTRLGASMVDMGTGMWAAIGILAALRERERTGRGSRVVASLLDTALVWGSYHLMGYLATGHAPGPEGSGLASIVPYGAFPTADAWVMIAAGNDKLFRLLCGALGADDLTDDPRFLSNRDRVANRAALEERLTATTRDLTASDLLERLRRAGVPSGPIQDMAQVADDPQVHASGVLRSVSRTGHPDYRDVALPLEHDGRRWTAARPPPRVGEHSRAVLAELGLGDAFASGDGAEVSG